MTILNITFGQRPYYTAEGFLPIAAGGGRTDIQSDDVEDNISTKNKVFGELTAVYWAWKNLHDIDIIGMSHYRRYLIPSKGLCNGLIPYTKTFYNITWSHFQNLRYTLTPFERILNSGKVDFVFAKRWHFDHLTIREQFLQNHPFPEDLELTRTILSKHHPEAIEAWDKFMIGSDAYCCCLFICKWEQFDNLCSWMFPILFEIERNLDIRKYDSYQQRIIAYLYERLLNVYIDYFHFRIMETPFYMIGDGPFKSIPRQDIGAKVWDVIRRLKNYERTK